MLFDLIRSFSVISTKIMDLNLIFDVFQYQSREKIQIDFKATNWCLFLKYCQVVLEVNL